MRINGKEQIMKKFPLKLLCFLLVNSTGLLIIVTKKKVFCNVGNNTQVVTLVFDNFSHSVLLL